ncbi:hypothetical protein NPIL_328311 [Nephila pilipes]|uniref:Uncharacterized protein n=1 Tax=Nephila pilipes TaxID=299642 RepID=A0A8X6NUM3_NEPPI|nr:hypothetical protein NPIL_328311 [Nephila pilipes]
MHHSPIQGGVSHNQFQMENIGFPRCRTTSKNIQGRVKRQPPEKKLPLMRGTPYLVVPPTALTVLHYQYYPPRTKHGDSECSSIHHYHLSYIPIYDSLHGYR